jgi:hypothetical protein
MAFLLIADEPMPDFVARLLKATSEELFGALDFYAGYECWRHHLGIIRSEITARNISPQRTASAGILRRIVRRFF